MSYYFSHVRLVGHPQNNDWLRDLSRHGEPYRDHALIWRLFPGDGASRDFIFRRLDDDRSYYVVSARPPSIDSGLFQIQTKAYNPQINPDEWVRFDLRANPTVSVRSGSGGSKRHDVLMHAKCQLSDPSGEQLANALEAAGKQWLLKRAEQWGLEVRADSVLQTGYRQHKLSRKGKGIEYSTLDYQGIARVIDSDRLTHALLAGVGHSKGFGCGLLLVKRVD
jgi:CRISPR system Cascade subunit CasE